MSTLNGTAILSLEILAHRWRPAVHATNAMHAVTLKMRPS
jgi:hypothetical protein